MAAPPKQRRVSLAVPPSSFSMSWDFCDDTGPAGPSNLQQQQPRPFRKAKIRKSDPQDPAAPLPEKKPRKKWTPEETQMLVEGCNRHGVGNWKTILSDCSLEFDSRSSVDLKDRFRTYFPDAYQKHYPNARTHLSSKIRSTLPDGSPLFGKTRSKRRRPFTEEEDKALKAGYEKHGTIWAAIVKDPVFQEQNRRSTDLRDRFRNAYPDLYEAAGYKPRNNKKKQHLIDDSQITTRAATDDLIPASSPGRTGPVRGTRRRRAQTSQGILLRGGTKSVPQSTFPSEDEDSSLEDTDADLSSHLKTQALSKTPALADQPSMTDGIKNLQLFSPAVPAEASFSSIVDDHAEIDLRSITTEPLSPDPLTEYPPSSVLDSQSRISRDNNITTHIHRSTWSSPVSHTPVKDSSGGGSNLPGSSAAANGSSHTRSYAKTSAPQQQHGPRGLKVGQSAWGPQEWLSPNPRLDSSFNTPINTTRVTSGNAAVNAPPATENSTPGSGTPSSYFSPSSPLASFDLTPLHTSQPLSPSTTAAAIQTSNNVVTQNVGSTAVASASLNALVGLTTLNLPISPLNNYSSHQHHHVIERYDLWPPALALSSSCSAVNNSSACSSVLGGSVSGPGSLSAFSSSFCGDFESEVSLDTQSQTFSDDREQQDVFGGDGTYDLGYTTTNATGNGGALSVTRAITHHSDYAGDLIFGARGYGLGGGFGWFGSAYGPSSNGHSDNDINDPQSAMVDGPVTGLGLVGISESEKEMGIKDDGDGVVPGDGRGNINPMQLHASSSEIDGPQERDVDEEMSDAAIDEDDDVMDGTNQLTTCPRISVDAESELVSAKTPSPENQQQRRNVAKIPNSNSTEASPVRMGHISSSDKCSHHRHQQQSLHQDGFSAQHNHQNTHTMTHSGHSLSLSLGSSTMFSPSPASLSTPGANTYGRFSLDDLDLVDLTQPSALADMNNLTPPATPMMQHITQLKGGKKYGVSSIGLSGSGKLGAGGGSSFMPGREQTSHQEQGHSLRSISVPPSEARNTISSPVASFSPVPEAVERGRPKIVDTMDTAKRSLSSTVHDLPGPNTSHGHSLSLSTLPPLPSHSEIWRSTTPTARVSSSASVTQGQGLSVGANAITDATTLFSHLLSSPSNLFGSNTSGGIDPSGIGVNSEVNTHVDLPFLDSHYNFGQHPSNNQQFQQNFGATAMLVDTPAPTPDVAHSSSTDSGNGIRRMTQAEVEARLALDLAQPFDTHHTHENTAHAQALRYLSLHDFMSNQAQQSDFDYPGTSSTSASDAAGLKALNPVFSIPPSLSRQVFPVTNLMRSQQQQQQQQQLGHQRMQSQQVVNPKDLVLNANGAGAAGLSASRLESKRKRASWDGSIL